MTTLDLRGSGGTLRLVAQRRHGATVRSFLGATSANAVKVAAGARLHDVAVDGNRANVTITGAAAVDIVGDDATVRNVSVTNAYGYGIRASNVNRPRILDCPVSGTRNIGIFVQVSATGTADQADPVVARCTVDRTSEGIGIAAGGIQIHGTSPFVVQRPKVLDNTVLMPSAPTSSGAICIEIFGGTQSGVVQGNTTKGGSMGVSVDNSTGASVAGNTCQGFNLYGVEFASSPWGVAVGNTLDGTGIGAAGIITDNTRVPYVGLSGNAIRGCTRGIRVIGSQQASITGNVISELTSYGIEVVGADQCAVVGNTVNGGSKSVMLDTVADSVVTGNSLLGFSQNGVLVFASTAVSLMATVVGNRTQGTAGTQVGTQLTNGATMANGSIVSANPGASAEFPDWGRNITKRLSSGAPTASDGDGSMGVRYGGGAHEALYMRSLAGWRRVAFADARGVVTKTTNYAVALNDDIVLVNGAITVTLPSASVAGPGQVFHLRNISASAATVTATAGNVDGAATSSIPAGLAAAYVTDGTNWWSVVVPQAAGGGGTTTTVVADVQAFTASGTWTAPAGAKSLFVTCVGAGGGGGSGRRGAAASIRCGGGGGGGGGITRVSVPASAVSSPVTVTVGTGGAGGTAIAVNDTSGNAGATGGNTTFGSFVRANGGGGGAGGTATSGTAGAAGAGEVSGATGGGASATGGTGVASSGTASGTAGGGSGGGITSADVASAGGTGGTSITVQNVAASGGVVDGATPGNGNSKTAGSALPGCGGGGGAGSITTTAQTGGTGGSYGAGGGGGGASVNGNSSGAGGAGGDGMCLVVSH
jgi:parallel beta-helix repeat protein